MLITQFPTPHYIHAFQPADSNAMATYEVSHFSLCRHLSEIISFDFSARKLA